MQRDKEWLAQVGINDVSLALTAMLGMQLFSINIWRKNEWRL